MDTNVVIASLSNQLPDNSNLIIDRLPGTISVITRIELLGWYNASPAQLARIQPFINGAQICNLSEEIILQAITIRQQLKIKLPDAVIAATALIYNYTLLTRNTDDFKNIPNLVFENPWLW